MRKGFSIIEVVISITIIGILTSVMIPTYKNYNKSSDDLIIKEKTLVIQNEIMVYINDQLSKAYNIYPIVGSSSTSTVGVNNVSASTLKTFVYGAMSGSQILDINTFTKVQEEEFTGFTNGVGYMNVRIIYKSGDNVVINFKIVDNVLECTATDSYRLAKKVIRLDQSLSESVNIITINSTGYVKNSDIAVSIASKVVEREVQKKDHDSFVDEFIRNVGEDK